MSLKETDYGIGYGPTLRGTTAPLSRIRTMASMVASRIDADGDPLLYRHVPAVDGEEQDRPCRYPASLEDAIGPVLSDKTLGDHTWDSATATVGLFAGSIAASGIVRLSETRTRRASEQEIEWAHFYRAAQRAYDYVIEQMGCGFCPTANEISRWQPAETATN